MGGVLSNQMSWMTATATVSGDFIEWSVGGWVSAKGRHDGATVGGQLGYT